jgi:hypothetical protein
MMADYMLKVQSFILRGAPVEDWRNIEQHLGCDHYYTKQARSDALDLTEIPRTLTSLSTATADLGCLPRVLRQQIAFIDQLNDDFPASDSDDADLRMRDRLQLMHLSCERIESRIITMKESVQSMVQMVGSEHQRYNKR